MTEHLQKLTECSICFKEFDDPRMLPCIHTFCLDCIEQTSEETNKKPGEKMPCPLCRKEFSIPTEGMNGLQKNFFLQHLMDVTAMFQPVNKPVLVCDMCKALHERDEERAKERDKEKIEEATMLCLECRNNFCEKCAKRHKLSKLSKAHNIVKTGNGTEEDIRKMRPTRNCPVHKQQPLNFYCADCKKILCVSCFVENHALHKCKDVTTVHEEFRQTIEKDVMKISNCVEEILSKKRMVEQRKAEVLLNLSRTEDKIQQRNLELKEMIDSHTTSLLEELSLIKQKQIKKFATEIEEIDRISGILKSFETYCTELVSKGSASDICGCVDELITRTNDLEKDHGTFIGHPFEMTEVSFKDTDLRGLLSDPSNNIVGQIECKLIGCAVSSPQHPSPPSDHEADQRQSVATDQIKKEKTTDEMLGTLYESGHQMSSSIQSDSGERAEKAFTTSDMLTKEGQKNEDHDDCGITFHEALTKYKVMLEKIRDQVIHIKFQTMSKNQSPLIKIEEANKLHRQFNHVSCLSGRTSDNEKLTRQTEHWRCIQTHHNLVVEFACIETAEDYIFEGILEEVNVFIEEILYRLDAER